MTGGERVTIDNSYKRTAMKESREMGGGTAGCECGLMRDLTQMGHITAWGWG